MKLTEQAARARQRKAISVEHLPFDAAGESTTVGRMETQGTDSSFTVATSYAMRCAQSRLAPLWPPLIRDA